MVSFEEIQAAYYMVAATGVLVAAVFYILNLRISQRNQEISMKNQELSLKAQELSAKAQEHTLETRQIQLFMDLYQVFRNKEFQRDIATIYNIWEWKDYDDFQAKYGRSTHPDEYSSYSSVTNFMGGLGVLVKRGMIDPTLVSELMGGVIIRYWEKIAALTRETRIKRSWPEYGGEVEYLYEAMKKLR